MKKGFILHLLSKLAFAVFAVILHVFLGRKLPMEKYGMVGIILNVVNINYLFVSNGVRQAASMFVARHAYAWADLVKKCVIIQLFLGLGLFIGNFFGARIIAGFLDDYTIQTYLKQTAIIIPITALYFLCLGLLNGERRFSAESGLAALYPLLRLVCIPLIVFFPSYDSISFVIFGLIFAAFATTTLGAAFIVAKPGSPKQAPSISLREIVTKSFALILFYAGVTLLMNIDTMILKHITSDNKAVGLYTAASSFSKIISYASVALSSVIIPNISKLFHEDNHDEAQKIFQKGFDFFVVVMAPLFIVLAASGKHLFSILYSQQYLAAGEVFAVLVPAIFFLSLATYFNTVLHAVKNPKGHVITLLLLIINVWLNFLLIPRIGFMGPGIALLIAACLGFLLFFFGIQRVFPFTFVGKQIFKRGCLIVATLVVSLLVYQFFSFPTLLSLAVSYVMLLCAIAMLMWVLGFFTSEKIIRTVGSFSK